MDQIGAGVTGTGNIARSISAPPRKIPHVGIYALCDLNAGLLKQRACPCVLAARNTQETLAMKCEF